MLVDAREHRFQLGVVGVLTLAFASLRRPRLAVLLAVGTALPLLPAIYRRFIAPRAGPPGAVEDKRLPAFARIAGGAGLASAGLVANARPSRITFGFLTATGVLCIYGAATGYCVPCSLLMRMEDSGLVSLDPPLVCAVPR